MAIGNKNGYFQMNLPREVITHYANDLSLRLTCFRLLAAVAVVGS